MRKVEEKLWGEVWKSVLGCGRRCGKCVRVEAGGGAGKCGEVKERCGGSGKVWGKV